MDGAIIMQFKIKKEMNVKIYMEFINHWDEVTDSVLVAQFRTMGWARNFIEEIKKIEETDKTIRFRIEEVVK
jgi:hypothetical protein